MSGTVVRIAETRAMLNALGPRPESSAVENARHALSVIDTHLAHELESITRETRPVSVDPSQWESYKAVKEEDAIEAAEEEKLPYKSIIQLHELHDVYKGMLKIAESPNLGGLGSPTRSPMHPLYITDDVDADVARALLEAHELRSEKLVLSGQRMTWLPDALGKIKSILILDLSQNSLQSLPDLSGLVNLLTLDASSNQLGFLPESIGSLKKLRVLNISGNGLKCLPDTIGQCYSLVDLDVSFNKIDKLPQTIGCLYNLERLSLQLNKLSGLPASICDLACLIVLQVHFNSLQALPFEIGNLKELKVLNASSNFNSLTTIPNSIGNLSKLTELDLSYNQIRELPLSFGRLHKLERLKLDQNPLVNPPTHVVEHSVEAVLEYMTERWKISLRLDGEDNDEENMSKSSMTVFGGVTSCLTSWLSGIACARPSSAKVLNWHNTNGYVEQS